MTTLPQITWSLSLSLPHYPPSSSTATPASHPRGKFGSDARDPSTSDKADVHASTPNPILDIRMVLFERRRCCIEQPLWCCCNFMLLVWSGDVLLDLIADDREEPPMPEERNPLGSWLFNTRNLIYQDVIWAETEGELCRWVRGKGKDVESWRGYVLGYWLWLAPKQRKIQ